MYRLEAEGIDAPAGSMGPKLQAARDFAAQGGDAVIGRLDDALNLVAGRAGTRIHRPA